MIKNFISDFIDEVVEVEELTFEKKRSSLKRFLVKVPFSRKDEVNNPEFWPVNVVIKRFNMQVYKKNSPADSF